MKKEPKSQTMWMAWHPKNKWKPYVYAKTKKDCLWEIERSMLCVPNKEIGWYAYRATIKPAEKVN
jgi:hypothetical protein